MAKYYRKRKSSSGYRKKGRKSGSTKKRGGARRRSRKVGSYAAFVKKNFSAIYRKLHGSAKSKFAKATKLVAQKYRRGH